MWVVECPSIPGYVGQGKAKPQALKNIEEAIALMFWRSERNGRMPLTTRLVSLK